MTPESNHPDDRLQPTQSIRNDDLLPLVVKEHIDRVCLAFEDAWQSGQQPQVAVTGRFKTSH